MTINTLNHFIGGRVAAGASGRSQDVFNPATGVVTGKVARANAAEVGKAIAVAQAVGGAVEGRIAHVGGALRTAAATTATVIVLLPQAVAIQRVAEAVAQPEFRIQREQQR